MHFKRQPCHVLQPNVIWVLHYRHRFWKDCDNKREPLDRREWWITGACYCIHAPKGWKLSGNTSTEEEEKMNESCWTTWRSRCHSNAAIGEPSRPRIHRANRSFTATGNVSCKCKPSCKWKRTFFSERKWFVDRVHLQPQNSTKTLFASPTCTTCWWSLSETGREPTVTLCRMWLQWNE